MGRARGQVYTVLTDLDRRFVMSPEHFRSAQVGRNYRCSRIVTGFLGELKSCPKRAVGRVEFAQPLHATSDRKSTRLNSSHSQISYAVFCLKKKKKKRQYK